MSRWLSWFAQIEQRSPHSYEPLAALDLRPADLQPEEWPDDAVYDLASCAGY